ncbi:putative hydro-lyase [Mycobacterium sp. 236(2023)]|uniref:putative hydro-lyase n=1 Tax=Mycobacterium sp. 236(2023) TaxID=3038163 RepID=UPI0024151685|nr:putative hydro-lyase [Mycobacterium sp. 236(2023)]MDG4668594.1 putative hydro-lyase [Mycobacterium sp. 236(2023)]
MRSATAPAATTASAARADIRVGAHTGPTSGLADGCAQANLVVLPQDHALDFLRFCVRNPVPCPVLDVTDTGSPRTRLADDADLRSDIPRYRVFSDGVCIDEPSDVVQYWRADLVAFVLGCSFTFEWALAAAGVPLAHQDQGVNVPMYVTNRACVSAGVFSGPLVVSMRPVPRHLVDLAVSVTARFPAMHGAPVHIGDPTAIGICDLAAPDFGDPVRVEPDDIPVFWACGVTPQVIAERARPPLAIFHAPGHMFITDRPHGHYDSASREQITDQPGGHA